MCQQGLYPAHAAVLYRTNAQSRAFEDACRRAGLRYRLVGGFGFYARAEVRDVLAYLKATANPLDSLSLLGVVNTPPRGVGEATVGKIQAYAGEQGVSCWKAIRQMTEKGLVPPKARAALDSFLRVMARLLEVAEDGSVLDLVKAAVAETGYEARLRAAKGEDSAARLLNLAELMSAAAEAAQRGETLQDFLDHASLAPDRGEDEAAPVSLLTIHAAKGLEFPVVFLTGFEEGLLPHGGPDGGEALEEERRLCYVAMTRAESHLYLTHAESRRLYGRTVSARPSPFLGEIPRSLVEPVRVTYRAAAAGRPDDQDRS